MTKLRAGDAIFDITPALGPSSGSAPTQPVTSFGSATGQMDIDLRGASITMVILGHTPEAKVIDELVTDLWLLGDFPMRYRVWAVWQDFDHEGDDRISFQAVTYERLLNRRLVGAGGLLYNNTDVGTILWNTIQHTQAKSGGNLGITAGDITTGITASIDWAPGENIGQRLEEMMQDAGCYWTINENLVANVYVRADTVPIGEPVMWGVNGHNMQRASAGIGFANSVFMSGNPDTTPLFSIHPDILIDPRGLWEVALARPNQSDQAELTAAADGELALRYQGLSRWNVEYVTEHWVGSARIKPGDRATLIVPPTLAGPSVPPSSVQIECVSLSVGFTGDGGLEIRAVHEELPFGPDDNDEFKAVIGASSLALAASGTAVRNEEVVLDIAFVGASASWATGTGDATATYPAAYTAVADDFAVLWLAVKVADTGEYTTPSGWTKQATILTESGGTDMRLTAYTKHLTASESLPTITGDTVNLFGTWVEIYRNVDSTTPMDAAAVTSDTGFAPADFTPTGLTSVTDNAFVVVGVAQSAGQPLTIPTSQSFTETINEASTAATNLGVSAAYKEIVTAGSVTCPTWDMPAPSGTYNAIVLALRPGTGTGEPPPPPVSGILVPTTGAWLGASVTSSPAGLTLYNSIDGGAVRPPQILGVYKTGNWNGKFTTGELAMFADSGGGARAIPHVRWKPDTDASAPYMSWANIAAGNCDTILNAAFAQLATWPGKMFMTIWHEPEDEVPSYGSNTDWINMWIHCHNRATAQGATNLVWVPNFGGYRGHAADHIVPMLAGIVGYFDWIAHDPYASTTASRDTLEELVNWNPSAPLVWNTIGPGYAGFYDWATATYPGVPQMLAEWGIDGGADGVGTITAAAAAVIIAEYQSSLASFPAIKAFEYWHNQGIGDYQWTDRSGVGEAEYAAFSNDPHFNQNTALAYSDGVPSAILVPSAGAWFGATTAADGIQSGSSLTGEAQWVAEIGSRPHIHTLYKTGAYNGLFTGSEAALFDPGGGEPHAIPFVHWKVGNSSGNGTWADVANGLYDTQIDSFGAGISTYGSPVFFSIFHEGEDNVSTGEWTKAWYVAMWQHVRDRLTANGVTNLIYVLQYVGYSGWADSAAGVGFEDMYPGDTYVDWIAWDPYADILARNTTEELLNENYASEAGWTGFYNWATTYHADKPLMLGEFGINMYAQTDSQAAAIIDNWAGDVTSYPAIKAWIYWNAVKAGYIDAQITGEPLASAALATMVNLAHFNQNPNLAL